MLANLHKWKQKLLKYCIKYSLFSCKFVHFFSSHPFMNLMLIVIFITLLPYLVTNGWFGTFEENYPFLYDVYTAILSIISTSFCVWFLLCCLTEMYLKYNDIDIMEYWDGRKRI